MKRIPIGEVLKEYGYITEEQLQQALAYQKENKGKRLGKIMIELQFVTEGQMLEALARRLELQVVDLSGIQIDLKAVAMIPRQVAQKYSLIPIKLNDAHTMTIAMNDPLDFYAVEDVRQITQMNIQIVLDESARIRNAIDYYYSQVGTQEAFKKANSTVSVTVEELQATEDTEEATPIVQALNSLLTQGYNLGASDIHIEPFEEKVIVRMRVDGVVTEIATLSPSLHLSLIARIKIMSDMDIAERRLPQDGHFKTTVEKNDINARVSVIPTVFGEKAVIRFLFTNVTVDRAGTFGMSDANFKLFQQMFMSPHGIIYITGPTGSGKTTTLYMILEQLTNRPVNISTIEDPVERNLPKTNQVQVNNMAGLTFETGLRALLRQDPDIIMVGETRDSETASISVRAAITGHLVFSTLHTNDAVSSIVRLKDMGVPAYLAANSLVGIVAQRLMRKVCPHCAQTYQATDTECHALGISAANVRRAAGCSRCNNTGYRGRTAIHEVVLIDKDIRKLITADAPMEQIQQYLRQNKNFKTLYDEARRMVLEGISTMEEFYKVAYYAD